MTNENKTTNKKQIVILVLVLVGFLVPTIAGFIVYALPKFLISKYALKHKDAKSKIIKDTIIVGLVLGVLSTIGKYSELKDKQEALKQNITQPQ